LRCAADVARAHDATLFLVHAWVPGAIALAGHQFPAEHLRQAWEGAAWQRMGDALDAAFGGLPAGIQAELVIAEGNPGWILVRTATGAGDVLVIGAGRGGGTGRLWHATASRYCLAHARCPVLVIPPPELELAARHGLAGRALRHKIPELDRHRPGDPVSVSQRATKP
jgi:nucleotide-binding universal stress UspA family protein